MKLASDHTIDANKLQTPDGIFRCDYCGKIIPEEADNFIGIVLGQVGKAVELALQCNACEAQEAKN